MSIKQSELLRHYYKLKIKSIFWKLFRIPLKMGEYTFIDDKQDIMDRRRICLEHTANRPQLVKYYQDGNEGENFPRHRQCNRTTSAPCSWSDTYWVNDRCNKCGYVFPEWN